MPGSTILATNQVLQSMEVGAPPVADKEPQPAAWVREYQYEGGPKGEYSAAHSASEDILSDGVRRLIINATLWCMGMEKEISADADISFVGPYNPSTFSFKPSITDAVQARSRALNRQFLNRTMHSGEPDIRLKMIRN